MATDDMPGRLHRTLRRWLFRAFGIKVTPDLDSALDQLEADWKAHVNSVVEAKRADRRRAGRQR